MAASVSYSTVMTFMKLMQKEGITDIQKIGDKLFFKVIDQADGSLVDAQYDESEQQITFKK